MDDGESPALQARENHWKAIFLNFQEAFIAFLGGFYQEREKTFLLMKNGWEEIIVFLSCLEGQSTHEEYSTYILQIQKFFQTQNFFQNWPSQIKSDFHHQNFVDFLDLLEDFSIQNSWMIPIHSLIFLISIFQLKIMGGVFYGKDDVEEMEEYQQKLKILQQLIKKLRFSFENSRIIPHDNSNRYCTPNESGNSIENLWKWFEKYLIQELLMTFQEISYLPLISFRLFLFFQVFLKFFIVYYFPNQEVVFFIFRLFISLQSWKVVDKEEGRKKLILPYYEPMKAKILLQQKYVQAQIEKEKSYLGRMKKRKSTTKESFYGAGFWNDKVLDQYFEEKFNPSIDSIEANEQNPFLHDKESAYVYSEIVNYNKQLIEMSFSFQDYNLALISSLLSQKILQNDQPVFNTNLHFYITAFYKNKFCYELLKMFFKMDLSLVFRYYEGIKPKMEAKRCPSFLGRFFTLLIIISFILTE